MVKQFYNALLDEHRNIIASKIENSSDKKKTPEEITQQVQNPLTEAIAYVSKKIGLQPQAAFYDNARIKALEKTPSLLRLGAITQGKKVVVSNYFYKLLNRRKNPTELDKRLEKTKWYWYVLTIIIAIVIFCMPIIWYLKLASIIIDLICVFIIHVTPKPLSELENYTHYNMIDMAFGDKLLADSSVTTEIIFPTLTPRGQEVLKTMTASGMSLYCITPQDALKFTHENMKSMEHCADDKRQKAEQPIFYTMYNDIVVFLYGWPEGREQVLQEIQYLDGIIKDSEIEAVMKLVKTSKSTFDKAQEAKNHAAFPKREIVESISNDILYAFLRNIATLQTVQVNMDSMQNNEKLSKTKDMYAELKTKIIDHIQIYLSTYNKYVAEYTFLLESNVDDMISKMQALVSQVVYQPAAEIINKGEVIF